MLLLLLLLINPSPRSCQQTKTLALTIPCDLGSVLIVVANIVIVVVVIHFIRFYRPTLLGPPLLEAIAMTAQTVQTARAWLQMNIWAWLCTQSKSVQTARTAQMNIWAWLFTQSRLHRLHRLHRTDQRSVHNVIPQEVWVLVIGTNRGLPQVEPHLSQLLVPLLSGSQLLSFHLLSDECVIPVSVSHSKVPLASVWAGSS